tara:strand:- start:7972 stop:8340 length:369 start_codon:yes stop_codon:yes gene_type:complete
MIIDEIDIGNECVDCFQDTSQGSGRFINRIPARVDRQAGDVDNRWLDKCFGESVVTDDFWLGLEGYQCAECREMECEGKDCDYMVLDDYTIIDGSILCDSCVAKIPADEKIRLQKEQLAWFS